MYYISVIICSFNPKKDYLQRTIEHLKRQTLSRDSWELIIVDNGSDPALSGVIDLTWHQGARISVEPSLGLTHARLNGIHLAQGEILVFVDDDNLLESSYLETALRISEQFPFIGAWGGTCIAEYEEPPPEHLLGFEGILAVRAVNRVLWSNRYFDYEATPVGAGMCIRSGVAQKFEEIIKLNTDSPILGRTGDSLMSCEDHDMAWTSIALGLGVGVFPTLMLNHIIPAFRTEKQYLLRLHEAGELSTAVLKHKLSGELPAERLGDRYPRLKALYVAARAFFRTGDSAFPDRIDAARKRGYSKARRLIENSKVKRHETSI